MSSLSIIFYFYLLLGRNTGKGATVTLSGSRSFATLGQTHFRFTCTVTNDATPTLGSVSFSRGSETVPISSYDTTCSVGSSQPGYSQTCGGSGQFYLDIASVGSRDAAAWKCSRRSQDSDIITLPVYYGPNSNVILSPSSPQAVVETNALTLDCSAGTCNPPCSYTWTRGSDIVSNTARLQLININRNQAGGYICTVRNTGTGSTSTSSTLYVTVQYTPEVILVTPQGCQSPMTVYDGQQNVQLTCQVTAAIPTVTSYIWTLNGSPIQSATSSVYSLSPVSRSRGGTYTCAGRNSVGSSVSPASVQVEVQYSPVVTVINSKTVIEGQTLTVTCSVDSNPAATVRWTRNGDNSFSQTGSTLTISNIHRSQTGTYMCTATNTLSPCTGAAPTSTAGVGQVTVSVQSAPYDINLQPSTLSYTKTEGQESVPSITCTALCRPGCSSYTWYKNGIVYSNGASLNLGLAEKSQRGSYQCRATNTHGSNSSSEVSVGIIYSVTINNLTINSVPGTVIVDESDTVTLRCFVDSNPNSTIRLLNGSQEIARADNSLVMVSNWEAECHQRGDYFCTAQNNIGVAASSAVKLSVNCRPRLDATVSHKTLYSSVLGVNVTISVVVLAYPIPSFTWSTASSTKNLTGSTIAVSDISVNISLHLIRLLNEDYGEYILTVENGFGNPVSFTVSVSPEGPPSTPTNFTVLADGSTSLLVFWKQQHNGGSRQTFIVEYSQDKLTWYTGGTVNEVEDVDYLQQTVSNLSPSTSYYVRVVARNKYGDSRYTQIANVTTEDATEVMVSAPQMNAGVIAGATVGGLVVLLAIVIGVIFIVRKGCPCSVISSANDVAKTRSTVRQRADSANESYITPVAQGPYSDLNRAGDETQTYTELKTYENVESQQHQDSNLPVNSNNEETQEHNPHLYESLDKETYKTDTVSPSDSPYEPVEEDQRNN